ncbi:MAG: NAD(P)H-binding protein, partial [Gemmatimonadetes bacterium]|nr:NAD(P)H-binding protein [Gemmatimonadota bacterium]
GVVEAVSGYTGGLISIMSDTEVECVRSIVGAAREAGVKRLVYVSGLTATPENAWFPLTAGKLASEEVLRGSAMPWTVVAPGWFYETLTLFVREGKAILVGDNPRSYRFLAASDFARIVRQAFEMSEAVNRRFVVKGPEGITIKDALQRYIEVRHPEIEKIAQPPIWLLHAIATLTRNKEMKLGIKLMSYFMKVGEPGDPTDTNELFGAPQTTLEEWLATP